MADAYMNAAKYIGAGLAASGRRPPFFPIAARAAAHPELVGRILAAGHTVGLHCHDHVRHSTRDRAWLEYDTARALELLATVDVTPTLWRTPYGDIAPHTGEVASRHRLRVVGWTVDTPDWRGDSAAAMFAATVPALRDGAVVLAHDGIGPGARRRDARETVAYVRRVASHAGRGHLRLEAL